MRVNYLAHHGILGMKWGVRRFQNKDGSLTPAGQRRYNVGLKIKGLDERAYYRYDKKTNPNKYGRLSDEQKQKYNYEDRLNLQSKIYDRAGEIENDIDLWNKYAAGAAAEYYDRRNSGKMAFRSPIEESKEKYIEDFIKDGQSGIDKMTLVSEYYTEHDPKLKKLSDKGEEWMQNLIKHEGDTGIGYGTVYEQLLDDWDARELAKR